MLEVGCGTGYVSAAIERDCPNIALTSAELFIRGASLAATRLQRAQVIQADARALPFESEFDVAGAFDVIEHIDDDRRVLQQMYTSLRPGGGLLITVPQHPWLWREIDEFSHHKRRYTREELRGKTEGAGFTVTRCTSFVTLLLPVMVASRPRSRQTVDRERQMKLPAPINAGFRFVMDFERVLIQAGASFPVGGSLLLVATKPSA